MLKTANRRMFLSAAVYRFSQTKMLGLFYINNLFFLQEEKLTINGSANPEKPAQLKYRSQPVLKGTLLKKFHNLQAESLVYCERWCYHPCLWGVIIPICGLE